MPARVGVWNKAISQGGSLGRNNLWDPQDKWTFGREGCKFVEALGMRLGGFGLEEQSERQKKSLQSAYIIFWQVWLEGL